MSRVRRENEFLGMSHGKAQYKLMQDVFFDLLKETNRHFCFRCGLELTRDNFSLDHKEFWLGVDSKLFWDKNNIAFSHIGCNAKHKRNPVSIHPFSKSGMKGVTVKKRVRFGDTVYKTRISHKRKSIYVGTFSNQLDAMKAYDKKSIELYGDFATTNKMLGFY